MQKVIDKEGILKAAREKQLVTYKGASNGLRNTTETSKDRKIGKKYSKWWKQEPTFKITLPSKVAFRIKGQIKKEKSF